MSADLSWRKKILTRSMLICVLTGFTSGLPLYFLINLLPAWWRSEHIDLKTIGLVALVGIPYTWKFVWSPLMDGFALPLGRRRGWMLATQMALLLTMLSFAWLKPQQDMRLILVAAVAVAFFSASQDVVLDAYRREILDNDELGLGNAIHVNAYRVAALVPGSLSLILADHLPWSQVFMVTALFMFVGVFLTLGLAREPVHAPQSKSWQVILIDPFWEFFTRQGLERGVWIIAFIFLYKLGDSMATALASPFYLDMGFSKTNIGLVAKNAGLWSSVIFGLLGGLWMVKIGINKALWLFGLVQVVSILGFVWLASFGHFAQVGARELWCLGGVIALEAAGVGLGTAAFVAFIARETNPVYAATQFALLTSIAAIPRTFMSASAGYLIEQLGYVNFYWLCAALALPGMVLLFKVAPWGASGSLKGQEWTR